MADKEGKIGPAPQPKVGAVPPLDRRPARIGAPPPPPPVTATGQVLGDAVYDLLARAGAKGRGVVSDLAKSAWEWGTRTDPDIEQLKQTYAHLLDIAQPPVSENPLIDAILQPGKTAHKYLFNYAAYPAESPLTALLSIGGVDMAANVLSSMTPRLLGKNPILELLKHVPPEKVAESLETWRAILEAFAKAHGWNENLETLESAIGEAPPPPGHGGEALGEGEAVPRWESDIQLPSGAAALPGEPIIPTRPHQ